MAHRAWPARMAKVFEGLAAALLLMLMLVVLVDVFGRNVLNRPLPWGTELLEVVLGAMVFLLYPVLALGGGHITVDLINTRPAIQRVQRTLASVVGAALFTLIAWCLVRQAVRAAGYGESTPLLGIPFALVLGGMAALAAIATLGFLVAGGRALRHEEAPPHSIEAI